VPEIENGEIKLEADDMSKGAKISFTFNEGLVVQIQPNGDCF